MTDEAIPLKISYTDEDVANAAKRDRFAKGTYCGIVAAITRQISKEKGHLMFKTVYRALKDPNDASSAFGPSLYQYQCLPFRNPNRDDHTPNKFFARSTNTWLAAHLPEEVIALPAKTEDGLMFKGEVIEWSEEEAAKKEAYDSTFETAGAMWEDESNEAMEKLVGIAVYFDVGYQEDSDFPSLDKFRSQLGEGEELVDPAIALTAEAAVEADADEEDEEPKKVAKPVAKKVAKKAIAKVNGSKAQRSRA